MLWATAATNEKPLETKRASCSKQDDNGGSGGNENKTVYPYNNKKSTAKGVCLFARFQYLHEQRHHIFKPDLAISVAVTPARALWRSSAASST